MSPSHRSSVKRVPAPGAALRGAGGGDHKTRSDVTMTTTHVGGARWAPAPSLLPPGRPLLNHQQGPGHREDHTRVAVVLLLRLFPPFFSRLPVSEQHGAGGGGGETTNSPPPSAESAQLWSGLWNHLLSCGILIQFRVIDLGFWEQYALILDTFRPHSVFAHKDTVRVPAPWPGRVRTILGESGVQASSSASTGHDLRDLKNVKGITPAWVLTESVRGTQNRGQAGGEGRDQQIQPRPQHRALLTRPTDRVQLSLEHFL